MLQAGAANFADLLADPGGEGGSAQLGGEAGASPLFKWTSDGSMMEELMKAYKSVNQPSCTYCSVVSQAQFPASHSVDMRRMDTLMVSAIALPCVSL